MTCSSEDGQEITAYGQLAVVTAPGSVYKTDEPVWRFGGLLVGRPVKQAGSEAESSRTLSRKEYGRELARGSGARPTRGGVRSHLGRVPERARSDTHCQESSIKRSSLVGCDRQCPASG